MATLNSLKCSAANCDTNRPCDAAGGGPTPCDAAGGGDHGDAAMALARQKLLLRLKPKWQRRGIESEGGSTVVSRAEGEVLANPETLEASECILDGWLVGLHNCRMQ